MKKDTLIIGFMLFAIFFGAGNLIFPPKLGLEMGNAFLPAITGFILTSVGLPLLTIIVGSFFHGGYKQALDKINPTFSLIFLIAVYLALGPGFGIPRTAATAYDMAIVPLLNEPSTLLLLVFSLLYFSAALWLSLNPSKMVDRVGAVLTPILLLFILLLITSAILLFANVDVTRPAPTDSAFSKGMVEGYFTMDILAAMAFSVIVIGAVKAKGGEGKNLTRQTIRAGLIAAVLLIFVYVSIGWIGNKMSPEMTALAAEKGQNVGTFILNTATQQAFGKFGQGVLAVIVILACLTSAVGLITAISQYFSQVFPKIAYKPYVWGFSLVSFVLANQGLNAVINTSVPVLLILYPISITVLLLLLIHKLRPIPYPIQRWIIGFVTFGAVLSTLGDKLGLPLVNRLPFKENAMEWIGFALIGAAVGYGLYVIRGKN